MSTARYPLSMPDHDAELDAIVAMLSDAGMVEEYVNEDGKPGPDGTLVGFREPKRWTYGSSASTSCANCSSIPKS